MSSPCETDEPVGSSSSTTRPCSVASSSRRRRRPSVDRPARRVLERRQKIEERWSRIPSQLVLERVRIDAPRVMRDRAELRPVTPSDRAARDRTSAPRRARAARPRSGATRRSSALQRPVREQDLAPEQTLWRSASHSRERPVAAHRPVVQHRLAVSLEHLPGAIGELRASGSSSGAGTPRASEIIWALPACTRRA